MWLNPTLVNVENEFYEKKMMEKSMGVEYSCELKIYNIQKID